MFIYGDLLATRPTQAGGSHPVGYPRLLLQSTCN